LVRLAEGICTISITTLLRKFKTTESVKMMLKSWKKFTMAVSLVAFCPFFPPGPGDYIQGLTLARQMPYHLNHSTNPFCVGHF
jgi:hypothetical protein